MQEEILWWNRDNRERFTRSDEDEFIQLAISLIMSGMLATALTTVILHWGGWKIKSKHQEVQPKKNTEMERSQK
jgi:hypothetical protein